MYPHIFYNWKIKEISNQYLEGKVKLVNNMKIVLLHKLEKKVYEAYSKDIKIYKNKEKEFEQTKANVLNNDENNNNQNNNANNNIITNQNNLIINQNNNNSIIYPNNNQITYPNNNHIEETKENELILNVNIKK